MCHGLQPSPGQHRPPYPLPPFPVVLKIPSATGMQPHLSSYRVFPSPWAQGGTQHSPWVHDRGHHCSVQVLGGSSSVDRRWVDSQSRTIPVSFPVHSPQQGHRRRAPDLWHVGEAHLCLTPILGWASSSKLPVLVPGQVPLFSSTSPQPLHSSASLIMI